MTEKVIIDGIDVSECKWINHWKHCDICSSLIKTIKAPSGKFRTKCLTEDDLCCVTFPDCYYKQLQRKTVECEVLQQTLDEVEEYCKKHLKMRMKGCHFEYTNNTKILAPIWKILDKAKG